MPMVRCYECKKKYSYAEDGFCPRCGSFNQPRKGSYVVNANGDIVRVHGINEAAHEGSFVHKEYHAEERQRKKLGLDKEPPKTVRRAAAPSADLTARRQKKENAGAAGIVVWAVVVMIILFNLLLETL